MLTNFREPWRWVSSIAVVRFDDTQGQVLDYEYPSNQLTQSERQDVKMLAMPECFQSVPSDLTVYNFRVRSSKHLPLHSLQVHEQDFEYGFALFQRVADSSRSRGYHQFSLVILSPWPFYELFTSILHQLRELYAVSGSEFFPMFYDSTRHWPQPTPGKSIDLPVLGRVCSTQIPVFADRMYSKLGFDERMDLSKIPYSQRVAPFEDTNIFSSLAYYGFLDHLWTLWQLVATGESILVIAPSADLCSLLVRALASLTSPMTYAGDVRPYFTTFDSDLDAISRGFGKYSAIIGVANPVFARVMSRCPNALILPADCPIGTVAHVKVYPTERSLEDAVFYSNRKQAPVLVMRHAPIIEPDPSVIQQIVTMSSIVSEGIDAHEMVRIHFVCGMLLREHFRKLTVSVLRPLERFFRVQMTAGDASGSTKKQRAVAMMKNMLGDSKQHQRSASQPQLACLSKGAQWMGVYADPESLLEPLNVQLFPHELRQDPSKFPPVLRSCKYWKIFTLFLASTNFKLWFAEERAVTVAELREIIRETCRLTEPQDLILATVVQSGNGHVRDTELLNLCLRIRAAIQAEQGRPDSLRDLELEARMAEHLAAVEAAISPALADAIREANVKPRIVTPVAVQRRATSLRAVLGKLTSTQLPSSPNPQDDGECTNEYKVST